MLITWHNSVDADKDTLIIGIVNVDCPKEQSDIKCTVFTNSPQHPCKFTHTGICVIPVTRIVRELDLRLNINEEEFDIEDEVYNNLTNTNENDRPEPLYRLTASRAGRKRKRTFYWLFL